MPAPRQPLQRLVQQTVARWNALHDTVGSYANDAGRAGMGHLFNPPHPGEILRLDVLPVSGLTVTEAAQQLGVTRTALLRVLHGHAVISPDMARRIEAWLGPERAGRAPTADDCLAEPPVTGA